MTYDEELLLIQEAKNQILSGIGKFQTALKYIHQSKSMNHTTIISLQNLNRILFNIECELQEL